MHASSAPAVPADPSDAASRRAIVLGASIAGLLAARVLAEHFDEVLLLERDPLPEQPAPRKGTPQAVHPHGLLARGREAIEALFPGITDALLARGALGGDIGSDAALEVDRRRFHPCTTGRLALAVSRLALEAEIRSRMRAHPRVRLLDGVEVRAPVHDAARGRVTGVRIARDGAGPAEEVLGAALVIDCTGRGSRSPAWLRQWGWEPPPEERVVIDLSYTSARFRRDAAAPPPLACVIGAASPGMPRPSVLLAQEPGADGQACWVAGVGAYAGDHPAPTLEGLRQRAREMGCAQIAELAARGELLGPVMSYRVPHSQRRRYERLRRFPEGYLVMGDALASFNPVYGQGMTVVACEALALREALERGGAGLARRFFRAAARVIDIPWQLAVGGDLALPCVPGPRPLALRLVNAYVARLQRAAVHDPVVAAAFLEVLHLLQAPPSLFRPRVLARVLRHGGRGRPATPAPPRLA